MSQTLVLGTDHAGFHLKESIKAFLESKGVQVIDVGCFDSTPVDYPAVGAKLVHTMKEKKIPQGILCCGSGVGMGMAANRFQGIRAVVANDAFTAKMSRLHNDANVLCMGGRFIAPEMGIEIVNTWLETPFEGPRHQQRIDLLDDIADEVSEVIPSC